MIYTRGPYEDYDRWANLTGDPGWSWHSLLPYFLKVCPLGLRHKRPMLICNDQSEKWSLPADNHNVTGQYDPAFHNTEGIVGVSIPGYPQAISEPLREAAEEIGLKYDLDVNDGVPMGIGKSVSDLYRNHH